MYFHHVVTDEDPFRWHRKVTSFIEWPGWNVSLELAVAPACLAEPVDVTKPATRRMRAQAPSVLVVCTRTEA